MYGKVQVTSMNRSTTFDGRSPPVNKSTWMTPIFITPYSEEYLLVTLYSEEYLLVTLYSEEEYLLVYMSPHLYNEDMYQYSIHITEVLSILIILRRVTLYTWTR